MRVLVWQWGRFGAGPRIATDFAAQFNTVPTTDAVLSLSTHAEILEGPHRPRCELPVPTYTTMAGYAARMLSAPLMIPWLARHIAALQPDLAFCAMPGPLDLVMHAALRRLRIPYAVVAHDADLHPGDGYPLQMSLQRRLLRKADAIVVLSDHVRTRLAMQRLTQGKPVLHATLPAPAADPPPPPCAHGGKMRLLCFGRLLPYKGLDLLADSLSLLLPRHDVEIRVVGSGPETRALATLRGLPGVSVENRWVPEGEVEALMAWADGVVLTHREASQSGVAAIAMAAGRWIVSTRVGGLREQLEDYRMALLCDVEARAIAHSLTRLLADPAPLSRTPPRAGAAALVAQLAASLGRSA